MPDWMKELFAAIDREDPDGFVAFLTEDGSFRFGNAPAVEGRENVREAVAGFFDSIGGLSHEVIGAWEDGDTTICEMRVTYTRKDGGIVEVPAANIFRMRDGLVHDYRIFVDNAAVYA